MQDAPLLKVVFAGKPDADSVTASPITVFDVRSILTVVLFACSTDPEQVVVVAQGGDGYLMVKSNGAETVSVKVVVLVVELTPETPVIVMV